METSFLCVHHCCSATIPLILSTFYQQQDASLLVNASVCNVSETSLYEEVLEHIWE